MLCDLTALMTMGLHYECFSHDCEHEGKSSKQALMALGGHACQHEPTTLLEHAGLLAEVLGINESSLPAYHRGQQGP